mmetsp:Transcript_5701/g.12431  ORF Transcript_5701/g.12431 Transcript_5701/m.12431 type:complete len:248 (+) Transcript_5701:1531-2274(+)
MPSRATGSRLLCLVVAGIYNQQTRPCWSFVLPRMTSGTVPRLLLSSATMRIFATSLLQPVLTATIAQLQRSRRLQQIFASFIVIMSFGQTMMFLQQTSFPTICSQYALWRKRVGSPLQSWPCSTTQFSSSCTSRGRGGQARQLLTQSSRMADGRFSQLHMNFAPTTISQLLPLDLVQSLDGEGYSKISIMPCKCSLSGGPCVRKDAPGQELAQRLSWRNGHREVLPMLAHTDSSMAIHPSTRILSCQ